MKEGLFFEEGICLLCPHKCRIKEGMVGRCNARKNIKGKIYSLSYSKVSCISIDPVEKKPLYHFYPGKKILSVGSYGCNLRCMHCQNHDISLAFSLEEAFSDKKIVSPQKIIELCIENNISLIAFTYNEPTVFFEYMFDILKLAKRASPKNNIKCVIVTNGFTSISAINKIIPYIDAANIDLKAFSDSFYSKICGGRLKPVLDAIKYYIRKGVWVEITNLLIPKLNDSELMIKKLCKWARLECGEDVPLHFSAFFPRYKLKHLNPTSLAKLIQAKETAESYGLNYVYIGNTSFGRSSNTECNLCKKKVIERKGYIVKYKELDKSGRCSCGNKIPGIWE
jgi:pyruvate formate lyase activating enzyme